MLFLKLILLKESSALVSLELILRREDTQDKSRDGYKTDNGLMR